ncbi:MAG: glycosyltransferase [Micromonosporaceae bacterium]
MRIAMISEHASPLAQLGTVDAGGQNLHVAELSAALAQLGHDVRVYTRRDRLDLPPVESMPPGVDVVHVPAGPPEPVPKDHLLPYMKPFGRWLATAWRDGDWSPDVVHAHFWMSGIAALVARRLHPVPVVQTFHALGSVKRRYQRQKDTSPPSRIGLERALGRGVDRVIAQCRDEVDELLRMGIPRHQISVIPSGVDSATFSPLGPGAPRSANSPRILTVGRLVERKGFEDVIRALRLVPKAEVVVVGGPPADELRDDPEAERLRAVAVDCGVNHRVRLVGAVPRGEMPLWYRSADVLVCAPWYEPFGLTPLEGMACGVPVVATAVGGLMDTVVDGFTGELVPPRDPNALGRALRHLLADPVRRLAYATAGVDRARQCYSWTRSAERLAVVYAQLREPVVAATPAAVTEAVAS